MFRRDRGAVLARNRHRVPVGLRVWVPRRVFAFVRRVGIVPCVLGLFRVQSLLTLRVMIVIVPGFIRTIHLLVTNLFWMSVSSHVQFVLPALRARRDLVGLARRVGLGASVV